MEAPSLSCILAVLRIRGILVRIRIRGKVLRLMDPAPDHAIFVVVLQDANKKLSFKVIQKSQSSRIQGFLTIFA